MTLSRAHIVRYWARIGQSSGVRGESPIDGSGALRGKGRVIVELAGALDVAPADLLAREHAHGEAIADLYVRLPSALRDFARGKILTAQTERLAAHCGLATDEMRLVLLKAMAAAPRPETRAFHHDDCRRLLDVYQLIPLDPVES